MNSHFKKKVLQDWRIIMLFNPAFCSIICFTTKSHIVIHCSRYFMQCYYAMTVVMKKHCTCRISWYWQYHNIYTDWVGNNGMNFPCLYIAAVQMTQYSEMLWNGCSLGFKATWLGLEKVIVGVEVRKLLELTMPERSIGHLFSENWAVDQMGFPSNGTFFWQSRFRNNEPSERRHNSHLRKDPNIPMKNNFLALVLFFSFFYSSLTLESGALCKTNPTCCCRVTPHYANSVHPRTQVVMRTETVGV